MVFGIQRMFATHSGRISQQWTYDAKAMIVYSAIIADLNRDGRQQIIVGTKDGRVLCLDENGKELWTYKTSETFSAQEAFFVDESRIHSIDAPPAVGDLNHDGKLEIIVASELGIIYCLDAQGKLLWKYESGGGIRASPLIVDMNMDGALEILFGCSHNKLVALTCDGKKIFEYDTDAPVESIPGVLKGKKIMIIFGNNKGVLTAITPAQELLWRVELPGKITAAPAFFHDTEEDRMVIGTLSGELCCVSEHGELVWEYKGNGSIYATAVIADLNDDTKPEIVFSSCDNNVHAVTNNGERVWSYETDFWIITQPFVADIDGDGKQEVVVGSFDKSIYVLDGMGTYVLDYVPGLSSIVNQAGHYSSVLTSDTGEQTGKKLFQYKTDGIIVGCTVLEKSHDKPLIIITTKNGLIQGYRHEK